MMNPCWQCPVASRGTDGICGMACESYEAWRKVHLPSEVPGDARENHRWADPEHPADGEPYSSIGREKR
jgi:hypothetical protein